MKMLVSIVADDDTFDSLDGHLPENSVWILCEPPSLATEDVVRHVLPPIHMLHERAKERGWSK